MYRKKGRGWTKHIDFMLLDVLCMQIAFIFSYIWRFGLEIGRASCRERV